MSDHEQRGTMSTSLTSYGDAGFSGFLRAASLQSAGLDAVDLARPVIGIADTASDFNPCHRQMPELVAAISRGVLEAGGLPLRFPSMSLAEATISPTSMYLRNLLAMETEELIRAQPMDAVVLVGGCDKTVPAHLMGAISADKPAIVVVTGPMLTSELRGRRVGACTDCRRLWADQRGGADDDGLLDEARSRLFPTSGTCMAMGTASTMACLAEAMGMMLPGGAAAPAPSGERLSIAAASGRRAVELAREGLRPSDILGPASFHNAAHTLAALGGSTNALIHLLAIARRAGVDLSLEDFHAAAAATPVIVDCKPVGKGFLEDLHRAGGMPTMLRSLRSQLDLSARTVMGGTIGDIVERAADPADWQHTIRTTDDAVHPTGGLLIVRGTLAPDGAVIKAAAADGELLCHRGPAAVFDSPADVEARIDDPELGLTADHVLILRNAGPVAAGMPEAGWLPIPAYLARAGVKDMVRISDARMSGTAFGTTVLHCAPEAAVGGPIGLVRDGDVIELDARAQRLDLLVDPAELARRRAELPPFAVPARGWAQLAAEHVLQANEGADLDFLARPIEPAEDATQHPDPRTIPEEGTL